MIIHHVLHLIHANVLDVDYQYDLISSPTLLLFVGTILAKGREKISLGFEHANNSM